MNLDTERQPGVKPTTKIYKAKLQPPVTVTHHLQRTHLLEQIQQAGAPRLVLIRAAAGFGKTTLMHQYRTQCLDNQRAVVWLNLDLADNDLQRMVTHLRAAFSDLLPALETATTEDSSELVFDLLEAIAELDLPFSILLDEFETIQSPPVLDFIQQLIEALPPHGLLMMTSRTAPDIGLGRIRARGQLLEIRPASLRFSLEEATTFLRDKHQLHLRDKDIATLHRCTEGWVAAIFLATLSLHGRSDHAAFVASFSGSNLELAEYLTDDILVHQSDACRQFLMQTSVLPQLSAPLCDAVTGRQDSQQMIDFLEKSNLFLFPLGDERHWYRYHSLFASFLRDALERQQPGLARQLQRRAADWYLADGKPVPAIELLLSAGAETEAVAEISAHANSLMESGRARLMSRWLEHIDASVLDDHPNLILTHAWALALCRRFSEAIEVVNRFLESGPQDNQQQRCALEAESIRCMLFAMTGQIEECCSAGLQLIDRLSAQQSFQYGVIANSLAYSLICTDRYDEARSVLSRAIRATSSDPSNFMRCITDCIESIIDLVQGRLGNALARLQDSRERHWDGATREIVAGKPSFNSTLAQVLYEIDATGDAERILLEALPYSRNNGSPDAMIANHLLISRLAYMHDDKEGWQRYLAELEHSGRQSGSSRAICCAWLERARVATLEGRLDNAEQDLRTADLHGDWERPGVSMHTTDVDTPSIARLRLRIAQGDCAAAAQALAQAIDLAQGQQRYRRVLKLRLLQAMALDGQGDAKAAFEALTTALRFASHEGFLRTFIDEGPRLANLLHRWNTQYQARGAANGIDGGFLVTLLERCKRSDDAAKALHAADSDIEILTAREIQVVQLLAAGLRNRAIAEKMFLSEFTIKSHLRNINAKLGAQGRTEAVAIARQKGFLD
ncbi:LuxR C-terminal-related transcriptional regulator [Pseudomonas sp. R37(2017)]|uniref:LuxR C-terminal-related transcriptional regulator n=1 Tax=Pseudomonas sp. R37(2017) TaxID=1981685 RepID=UPI000A1F85FF|nr:LuxR C-terminal-related transcriptional regulator [Pseudomonas sp. R37(2017)]